MFTLPKLPYGYNALEPYIDARTMEIHYTKHHQTYVTKLNEGLAELPDLLKKDLSELVRDLNKLPEQVQKIVRNHGGGHLNHSLFWTSLRPGQEGNGPDGKIMELTNTCFGDFDSFKQQFSDEATKLFGSGWVWLVKDADKLKIVSTVNQNNPISNGQDPLLGLDVWEHAYYLKYQNKRAEYVEAWWQLVNWTEVGSRLK